VARSPAHAWYEEDAVQRRVEGDGRKAQGCVGGQGPTFQDTGERGAPLVIRRLPDHQECSVIEISS
jgi:hypothetical protein